MVPLVIDITRLLRRRLRGRRATGVDRVGLAYVAHFGLADDARAVALLRLGGRWVFFSAPESRRLFALLAGDATVSLRSVGGLLLKRALRPGTHRPPPGACLLNVVHSGLERADHARRLAAFGLGGVYFVHDLFPLSHPHLHRAGEADRHRRRMRNALGTGRALIVNSAATLQALRSHAHAEGLRLPPCVVAHLAPGVLPGPGDALRLQSTPTTSNAPASHPYFLMLGTIEPRKNHALMLRVWHDLVARFGAAAPRLVVIGQPGWMCHDELAHLRGGDPAHTHVHYLERCNDAALAGWMRGACALLLPSLAEGYGLPLVEALAAGVPVLASDLPVFREIAGTVPAYLDRADAAAWQAAVMAYARAGSAERAAQVRRLRGFVAPRWPQHFAQVESLLERAHAAV